MMWLKYSETQFVNLACCTIFKIVDEANGKFTVWFGSLALNFTDKVLLQEAKSFILSDMTLISNALG